jgi:transposase
VAGKITLQPHQLKKLLEKFTQKELANILEVNEKTIRRRIKPNNKPLQKVGRKPKIEPHNLEFLQFYITARKTTTQKRLARYLSVSQPTICRALKKIGITYKKITYQASEQLRQQNKEKIKHFIDKIIPSLSQSNIFFLDECGFHLNLAPRRGYYLKGSRLISQKPGDKGKNHTLIFLTQITNGKKIIHSKLIEGGMKTKEFYEFLTEFNPPNNGKQNCLIMDNLSVHKAKQSCLKLGLSTIEELLASKNIKPIYLPSYTPEINPVEKMFNIVRQHIEKSRPRIKEKLISFIEERIKFFHDEDLTKYLKNSLKECLTKLSSTENIKLLSKVNIDEVEKNLERLADDREFVKSVNRKLVSMGIKLPYNGH